jgi:uracil-DNA glycosylase family 4
MFAYFYSVMIVKEASKKQELLNLAKEYEFCSRCPLLVQSRYQVVFGAGNPDTCKVVIIGEAPGTAENKQGVPFVGRSGKVLDEFLSDIGLKRPNDVYITNIILCRPPDNRNPTSVELHNCRSRLDRHISILDPKVIITLGNFATKYLLNTKEGITKIRGNPIEKVLLGKLRVVVPMQHPAVLLYHGNSSAKRAEFERDFNVVKEIVSRSI